MSSKTIRPGITAATGAVRALLAAGWKAGRVEQLADGSTEHGLLHPSGREITAITDGGRDSTDLTLTGLTLEQAAGAVLGAGLAPAVSPASPAEPTLRERLAAELHRIADDIVRLELPVDDTRLSLGVLDSRADLQRWAAYLGSEIAEDGGTAGNIPKTEHAIRLAPSRWQSLRVHAQIQPDQPSELERLRAENARLRAAQGGTR